MPRAFLVKPRPLDQVPVTSEWSRDLRHTSSVDASSWLQVDRDVNNNNVGRSSSTWLRTSGLDLRTVRPADDLAWRPFDVAGGPHWWSMIESRPDDVSAQPGPLGWRDTRGRDGPDVTSSAERSRSPSASSAAAAAAQSAAAVDEDAQHLWWSSSPHSDVSASGIKSSMTFTPHLSNTGRGCDPRS